mgnify:FL=1
MSSYTMSYDAAAALYNALSAQTPSEYVYDISDGAMDVRIPLSMITVSNGNLVVANGDLSSTDTTPTINVRFRYMNSYGGVNSQRNYVQFMLNNYSYNGQVLANIPAGDSTVAAITSLLTATPVGTVYESVGHVASYVATTDWTSEFIKFGIVVGSEQFGVVVYYFNNPNNGHYDLRVHGQTSAAGGGGGSGDPYIRTIN